MAIQIVKNNQNITLGATEDELILTPPFNVEGQVVLKHVSGTFKATVGGTTNDSNIRAYSTVNDTCVLTINPTSQMDSVNRIHAVGSGVCTITY